MFRKVKAPGVQTSNKSTGRLRTRRHLRQKYGSETPLPQPSRVRTIRTIAYFIAVFVIILSTLYWLFG